MSMLDLGIDDLVPVYQIQPRGKINSKIVIIGEKPDAYDLRAQSPFEGKAGTLLKKLMFQANLSQSNVYMTYLIKDQKTKMTDFKKTGLTEQGQKVLKSLRDEISELDCNIVVLLGDTLLRLFTDNSEIVKWRGSILESTLIPGLKVIPIIDPNVAMRNYIWRHYISADLRRTVHESSTPKLNPPERNLIINPSCEEAIAWFKSNSGIEKETKELTLDIEWSGQLQISCISFSYDPSEAISIPVMQYSLEDETTIWGVIASKIEDPNLAIIGQNVAFDLYDIMWKYSIIPQGPIEDTMIAHNIIYPDFLKSLGFLNSMYTNEPYYKDDLHEWKKVKDWPKFWRYNAKDSATTMEIWQRLKPRIADGGYQDTYDMTMRMHMPIFYAQYRGMAANRDGIAKVKVGIMKEIKRLQKKLDAQVKDTISQKELIKIDVETGAMGLLNVNSPPQLHAYFYLDLGIPAYKNKGKPTCDDSALQRLSKGTASRAGVPAARTIQELVGIKKFKSTYVNMKFGSDNRFRCRFNPRGTIFGRLSSAKTAFKTGTNMQNIPSQFRGFLQADPGYLLYELDKAGAEWVATAYITGDRNMIRAVESPVSPHVTTGNMITHIHPDIIMAEDKYLGHETDPSVILAMRKEFWSENPEYEKEFQAAKFYPRSMSIRQCGKKANHGFNYGLHYRAFALKNEILEADALSIYNGYHSSYHGIGEWYERIKLQLQKDRTLINPFNRKIRFLDAWGESLFMQAYSFLPQSTVGDVVNQAWADAYFSKDPDLLLGEILGSIHDSLVIQLPISAGIEAHMNYLDKMRSLLDPTITYEGRSFVIQTDGKVGHNWGTMTSFDFEDSEKRKRVIESEMSTLTIMPKEIT